MDRQQIAVKLAMDALGLDFKMDTFQDRLIFQKAIYLAQAAGVKLGYHYRWYRRGPYCSPLADDGFAISCELKTGEDELQGWCLDKTFSKILSKLKSGIFSDQKDLANTLELLASVHFLVRRTGLSKDNVPTITETLQNYGKNFSSSKVGKALGELAGYDLID